MAEAQWHAVAALVDPVRRALFDHVRAQDRPVTREAAADALGISRNLAAFHLDKLVDAGLLRSGSEPPRGQPRGRGRTPKVYQPSEGGLDLSIPRRRYELLAAILADAVAERPDDAGDAARRVARARGRDYGRRFKTGGDPLPTAVEALAELGFEPEPGPGGVLLLRNCPFHALAADQPELVCGLNLAFLKGVLKGLDLRDMSAHLAPRPGACCVEIRAGQDHT